jgi:hypothetical protein
MGMKSLEIYLNLNFEIALQPKEKLQFVFSKETKKNASTPPADSMKMSGSIMRKMNQLIKIPEVQKTMQTMQREMQKVWFQYQFIAGKKEWHE